MGRNNKKIGLPFGTYKFVFDCCGMVDSWTETVELEFDRDGWYGKSSVHGVDDDATNEQYRDLQRQEWERRRHEREQEIEEWDPELDGEQPPQPFDEDLDEIEVEREFVFCDFVRAEARAETFNELAGQLESEGSVEAERLSFSVKVGYPELAAYIRVESALHELEPDDLEERERIFPVVLSLFALAGDDL